MKTNILHLQQDKQDELRRITEIIREAVGPEMVILFGSHARGDWVEVARVFPRSAPEEEKRFDLLKRACVDARYDPDCAIGAGDLEYPAGCVRKLKALTRDSCRKKIESLGA